MHSGGSMQRAAARDCAVPKALVNRLRLEIESRPDNPLQKSMKYIRDVTSRTRVRAFVSDVLATNADYGYDAARMTRKHIDKVGWAFWECENTEEEIIKLLKKYIGLRRGRKIWTEQIEQEVVSSLAARRHGVVETTAVETESGVSPLANTEGFSLFSGTTSPGRAVPDDRLQCVISRDYSPFSSSFGGTGLWSEAPGLWHDDDGGTPEAAMRIPSPTTPTTPTPTPKITIRCHLCDQPASALSAWRAGVMCGHVLCGACCPSGTRACPVCPRDPINFLVTLK